MMRRHTDHSYVLRLWRDHAGAPLRATLIAVGRPDVHHHFNDLDELVSYLIVQISPRPEQGREEVRQPPEGMRAQYTAGNS
jgi:hypothetical protein